MIALVRAGVAWRVLPLVLVIEAFAILSRGTPWLGEWNWTTDWIDGAVMLVAPLAAACAAYDAAFLARGEMRDLALSTPRGGRSLAIPVLSTFVVLGCTHLLFVIGGLAANLAVGAGELPSLVPVPAALTALAAACGLGATIGAFLPALYAAPLAGALIVGYHLASGSGLGPQVLRMGGESGSLVGLTWDLRVLAVAIVIQLCLVAIPVVVVLPSLGPARGRGILSGAVCVLVLAVAGTAWETQGWSRIVESGDEISYRCLGTETEVCLATATSRKLDSLEAAMQPHLAQLRAAGADVPPVFRQAVPGRDPDGTAPLYFEGTTANSPTTTSAEAADYVLTPALCPAMTGDRPPPQAYADALTYLRGWLLVRAGLHDPEAAYDPALRAWLATPVTDQQAWVRETYRSLTGCRLGHVALPAS